MFIFNRVQLINTNTSESCLDLICVSHKYNISQSGVINIGLSDHFLRIVHKMFKQVLLKPIIP